MDDKPKFEHPQSQSMQIGIPDPQTNSDNLVTLRSYIDQKISTHIHNGTVSPRINANTDIIGTLGSVVYAGAVNSDGTTNHLPSGWTSSRTGVGQYTVTHNLGSALYSAPAIASGATAFPKFNAVNINDVQYVFLNDAASLTDTKFFFILTAFT